MILLKKKKKKEKKSVIVLNFFDLSAMFSCCNTKTKKCCKDSNNCLCTFEFFVHAIS